MDRRLLTAASISEYSEKLLQESRCTYLFLISLTNIFSMFFPFLLSSIYFFLSGYSDSVFTGQSHLETEKSVGYGCGWLAAQCYCQQNQVSISSLVCATVLYHSLCFCIVFLKSLFNLSLFFFCFISIGCEYYR